MRPLPKYLNSIKEFPRPQKIADARAWFGLVNQVARYGRLIGIMAPFKPLLSPRTPFHWNEELDNAFEASKLEIIQAIEQGVQIFDPKCKTCLSPDWSKVGVDYWLRQKYCNCVSETPDCCQEGWKITLAGSRLLSGGLEDNIGWVQIVVRRVGRQHWLGPDCCQEGWKITLAGSRLLSGGLEDNIG